MGEKRVTVVGVGLIGGSLCAACRKRGLRVRGVSGGETLSRAREMGIIEEGFPYGETERAVEGSDYVFLCTPLLDIAGRIGPVLRSVSPGTIVSDVGSTKRVIAETAGREIAGLGPKAPLFIGGHPMTGSEKRGVDHADPFLFYDAVYVLTPLPGTPRRAVKDLSALLGGFGAKVMVLDPELHDRIAADISHLPHMLAVLLVNHLAERGDETYRSLAAGGFRDMTRIASSSYSVWRDIVATNREEIGRSLGEFRDRLDVLLGEMESDGYLRDLFERAGEERATIPRYSKGFMKPLIDLRVSLEDKPGELARVTGIVFYHGINIKDIELVSVRAGEGGILRLGFAEREEADRALKGLASIGYQVSIVE
jgi:prephenate dehydrogenase